MDTGPSRTRAGYVGLVNRQLWAVQIPTKTSRCSSYIATGRETMELESFAKRVGSRLPLT